MSENRNVTVVVAWLAYLAVIVYLANLLGPVAIPFAGIMMVPLLVLMNMIYGNKEEDSDRIKMSEKRKRERIDNMIRDMSDDELYELRQRLQDGSIDEEILYNRVVGDDGEIVMR